MIAGESTKKRFDGGQVCVSLMRIADCAGYFFHHRSISKALAWIKSPRLQNPKSKNCHAFQGKPTGL